MSEEDRVQRRNVGVRVLVIATLDSRGGFLFVFLVSGEVVE